VESVKRLIPRPVLRRIRSYREDAHKLQLFGDLAPLVPPLESMYDGPRTLEHFKANGEEFCKIYREICGLKPNEKMLDVGSGIGRKTLPLTQYLDEQAIYQGIDVSKAGVDWCQEKISTRFPNFQFQHIDVYNKLYNPSGRTLPGEYEFPFADGSFSFVVLGSVFTHMLPADLNHYLREIQRVMQPGGRCLISYFLLNDESLSKIDEGTSTLDFKHVYEGCRVLSVERPEDAIAFAEGAIASMYRESRLEIRRIDYGSWCAREAYLSYQDLILAVKM
jgi:SAM-dependent methyltransferase